ncbi:MAG: lactonase family protein [Gemmatimonadales bacterium]
MPSFLYVSIAGEDKISIYTRDAVSGRLAFERDIPHADQPSPMAVDPQQHYLYVGRRRPGAFGLSSFRIDGATGGLEPIGAVPIAGDPVHLSTDQTGRFLLSAYFYQSKVAVHRLSDQGEIDASPIEWRDTAVGAHYIQSDASNQFAFVPHIAPGGALDGPNAIFQFKLNDHTGQLTPNSPDRVTPPANDGPRHLCFHPTLDIVYASNEQGCGVTAYRFDTSNGTLHPFSTVSTLPADFAGRNTCSQIQITPSGAFLYAPNRGHNSIACFAVDPSSGALTPVGHVATEPVPRAFSLDPQGKFLYASGLESGRLAAYRIQPDTGLLEPSEVYAIGPNPMWVLCLDL